MFRLYLALLLASASFAQSKAVAQTGEFSRPLAATSPSSPHSAQNVPSAKQSTSDPASTLLPTDTVVTIHGLCSDIGIGSAPADSNSCITRIKKADFDIFVESLRASGQRIPQELTPELRRTIAQTYVESLTFEEAGRKAGLDHDARFLTAMKGIRIVLLSRMYQFQMEQNAKQVSQGDVETYYRENPAKFEQLELTHLVIPTNNPTNLRDEEFHAKAEQLAQELRNRLAAGEDADKLEKEAFEKLSQKSPPATKLLPARRGDYSLDQEEKLFALKPGEVTPVVKLPSVYVVYKLISRRTIPLDEAKDEISLKLATERLERETKARRYAVHADYDSRYFGPSPSAASAASKAGAN